MLQMIYMHTYSKEFSSLFRYLFVSIPIFVRVRGVE